METQQHTCKNLLGKKKVPREIKTYLLSEDENTTYQNLWGHSTAEREVYIIKWMH